MRRNFLSLLAGLTGLGIAASLQSSRKMKILIKSAWGSADSTQASFPFHHAFAFAEAGHDVQIFLLGEAVTLMRTVVANVRIPGRLARALRSAGEGRSEENPDPRLRGVRESPWGSRNRSRREERRL
jgi:hypothetical protein